ncbi:hypothetical protein FOIG_15279 [Fusarium odoratissimum NRRL 54006]|uniref:NmrA-like domain-containing protein n=1 Tax=Fusarium odoratissimum (strain NRRL 54006) TaxID=1089451 RepID=X0J591_FUSO5|nr:uncharacterized protein FOIG_15279 [Fusarium odoratissimum NRRL 54006]EXL91526.1 hypothetical protein FOIG_15279 [Fusarium odoratissimum NRRL 54006]
MVHVVAVAGGQGDKLDDESTIYVDYTNASHIRDSLEKYNVEVVISCLNVICPEASQAEVNLARACDSSSSTRRFIASQWSIKVAQGSPLPDFSAAVKRWVWPDWFAWPPMDQRSIAATLAVLSQTKLEYTVVSNGHFSDYYGYPIVKTYLKHAAFLVDIANKTTAIPGSGQDKIAFTYSFDVTRFVDALVNTKDKWPKHSVIIGEKITANKIVAIAEDARGERFSVVHDDVNKLKSLQVTELPSHVEAYKFFPKPMLQTLLAAIGLWITEGHFNLAYEASLNQMFPNIELTSVKELIDQAWKA